MRVKSSRENPCFSIAESVITYKSHNKEFTIQFTFSQSFSGLYRQYTIIIALYIHLGI